MKQLGPLILTVLLAGGGGFFLGRSLPRPELPSPQQACGAEADGVWVLDSAAAWRVEAQLSGPNCADAVATAVVRTARGKPVHAFATAVSALPDRFAPDAALAARRAELAAWIGQDAAPRRTAGDLPPWPEGASGPADQGFRPAPDLDRAAYEALRAGGAPLLCLEDGAGRAQCVVATGATEGRLMGMRLASPAAAAP